MAFIYVCSCSLRHMMVTPLLFNATNRQWFDYMTQKIFHPYFLSLFINQMPIGMVLLATPPPLVFFISILLVCLGLHRIFKQTIHTCCHLDHFHFLATSCVTLLLMNISLFCSSPIDIMLGVINRSCTWDLSVWLAMDCLQELVASCSQNPNQTFVSLRHKLCILACHFLMPNIPL